MATTLGSPTWGSGPAIPCRWTYDRRRNGAAMEYRVYGYVNTDQATRYFGYYIDASVSISGASSYSTRLKENNPSTWSTQYTFDTGWKTVSNKTSGTTAVTVTLSSNAPRGSTSWSYTMAVDPAGSTLNAPNGVLGVEQTLTLTRYSSSFTDSISWACGSASGTIATKSSATSFRFTPALTLATQAPSASSVTITYTISTYSGNTLVQTQTVTATYTIPDTVKPTAALTISDAAGYSSTYGGYVQTKSRLRMQITGTPAYGSPIASYASTADGTTYSGNDVTTPALSQTGAQTATATVTDSRGRVSNPATQAYTVLAYTAPQITKMTANRGDQNGNQDPTGHFGIVIFSAAITPLNNVNTAAYKLRYKKTSASTWTETTLAAYAGQYSVSDGQAIFPADDDSAYDVQIVATDDFGSATIASGIPIAFTIMNWRTEGDGMAIGGINTQAGLQVYMDSEHIGDTTFTGDITGDANFTGDIFNYGINASDLILETKNKIFLWRENVNETYAGIQKTCDFENEALILNGTATGDVYYGYTCYFNTNHGIDAIPYRGQEMTLSIFPSGQGVRGFLAVYTDTSGNYYDIANSVTDEYTFTVPNDAVIFRIGVYIPSGTTINNVAFQMMLQASSTTNKTYTDFAPTNRDMVGSLFVKKFTTSTSIAGGGNAAITNSFITTPKGYTMVGVVGLSTNNVNVVPVSFRPMWGSSWDFELRNLSSSSSPTTLDVWVLFARGGLAILEQ